MRKEPVPCLYCDHEAVVHGMCQVHNRRVERTGRPDDPEVLERPTLDVSAVLPATLAARLVYQAQRTGMAKAVIIRLALERYLDGDNPDREVLKNWNS